MVFVRHRTVYLDIEIGLAHAHGADMETMQLVGLGLVYHYSVGKEATSLLTETLGGDAERTHREETVPLRTVRREHQCALFSTGVSFGYGKGPSVELRCEALVEIDMHRHIMQLAEQVYFVELTVVNAYALLALEMGTVETGQLDIAALGRYDVAAFGNLHNRRHVGIAFPYMGNGASGVIRKRNLEIVYVSQCGDGVLLLGGISYYIDPLRRETYPQTQTVIPVGMRHLVGTRVYGCYPCHHGECICKNLFHSRCHLTKSVLLRVSVTIGDLQDGDAH